MVMTELNLEVLPEEGVPICTEPSRHRGSVCTQPGDMKNHDSPSVRAEDFALLSAPTLSTDGLFTWIVIVSWQK